MSFFSGYSFFVYLFLALVPAVILGVTERSLRHYRMAATAFFIWMVFKREPAQFAWLAVYVVMACAAVKLYGRARVKWGRKGWIYGCAVGAVLLPVIISKAGGVWEKQVFGFLGISYLCFRVLQVIIEIYDGVIKEVRLPDFVRFLLFFPALSSGPIDRSRRFEADDQRVYKREEYLELLETGLYKLVLGMFYKIVCSALFYQLLADGFGENGSLSYGGWYTIGYAYAYGLYLFFDFAGYSSMAVGTSYVLGIRMPDNFNRPFLSVDMKDFWNRWHITLSSWLRDFVFTRFMVHAARKKWMKNRLARAWAGLMLNMVLMGLWHGPESRYLAYGIYHGLLLGGTEVYQKKFRFYQKNKHKAWYRLASWFLTLNLVMFGFLIFSGYGG